MSFIKVGCAFVCFTLLFSSASYANLIPDGIDSTVIFTSKFTINKHKYIGYIKAGYFFIETTSGRVLIKINGDYNSWTLKDMNGDGFKDILLDIPSNTPAICDLLVFVPTQNNFRKINNFSSFPDAIRIEGTKYYYSYHKSGCADMNWDSDLFYIKNNEAIRLGNIHGEQCGEDNTTPGKLSIFKVEGVKKKLISIQQSKVLSNYKGYKWDFIKGYWSKNYRLFLK